MKKSRARPRESVYACMNCGRSYNRKDNLDRHWKYECGKNPRFSCPYCVYRAKQRSNMYLHIKNVHKGLKVYVVDLEPES